ncbi:MAG: AlpA family transcriptional regulator [Pseudomonas sp.]|jgi:prophage regulatory protein|nr:MAG: AlpA family transcriptional regulator [Pseudomonas sp.]
MSRPPRLLRCPEVLERTGMPRASLYKQIAADAFPRPVPIGKQAVAWLESEIDAWVEKCINARDSAAQRQEA